MSPVLSFREVGISCIEIDFDPTVKSYDLYRSIIGDIPCDYVIASSFHNLESRPGKTRIQISDQELMIQSGQKCFVRIVDSCSDIEESIGSQEPVIIWPARDSYIVQRIVVMDRDFHMNEYDISKDLGRPADNVTILSDSPVRVTFDGSPRVHEFKPGSPLDYRDRPVTMINFSIDEDKPVPIIVIGV